MTADQRMTPFGLSDQVTRQLRRVFAEYADVERVVIYGSRARGDAKDYSDIDLAVFAPRMAASEFANLAWAIESLPIVFKIDLVRVDSLENEKLKERINAEGVDLWPPPDAD